MPFQSLFHCGSKSVGFSKPLTLERIEPDARPQQSQALLAFLDCGHFPDRQQICDDDTGTSAVAKFPRHHRNISLGTVHLKSGVRNASDSRSAVASHD